MTSRQFVGRFAFVAALIAAAALACARSARQLPLSACPPEIGAVVTPQTASAVVSADDAAGNAASAALDLSAQDNHESGARALVDDASFALRREQGMPPPAMALEHDRVSVYVPFQSTYPATFLAFGHVSPASAATTTSTTAPAPGPQSSGDEFLVFTRRSATDPWKDVATGPLDAGAARPAFQLDCNGFAVTADALDPSFAVPPGSLATRLAKYLNAYNSAAPPRSDFLGAQETTGFSASLHSTAAQATTEGAVQSFSAAPSVFPTTAWRTTDGRAFVVFSVGYSIRILPVAGHGPIKQPANRPVWPLLLPGSYPEVVWHYLAILAATVPPPTETPMIAPIAYSFGVVSASIDPCRLLTPAETAGILEAPVSVDARRDATGDICVFTTAARASLAVATRLATPADAPAGAAITDLGVPAGYKEAPIVGQAASVAGTLQFVAHGSRVTVTINATGASSPRARATAAAKLALAAASKL